MNKNVLSIFFSLVIITNVYAQQESKKDETYWGTLKKGASATYDYMTNTATQASKWIKENPRKSLGALLLTAWGGHALYEWQNAPIDLAHFNNFDIEPINLDFYNRDLRHTHYPHDGFDNPKNDASFIAAIPMPIHGEMFMHDIFGRASSSNTYPFLSSPTSSSQQNLVDQTVEEHWRQINAYLQAHQIEIPPTNGLRKIGIDSPILIQYYTQHAAERNILGDTGSRTARKQVSLEDILDALINPLFTRKPTKDSQGRISVKYEGQYASIVFGVNGNIVTVMPTHTDRAEKLKSVKNAPQPTPEKNL